MLTGKQFNKINLNERTRCKSIILTMVYHTTLQARFRQGVSKLSLDRKPVWVALKTIKKTLW